MLSRNKTATISHEALSGCLVSRPPTLQAPAQVQASESWGMAVLFAEQDAPQTTMLLPSLSHTHTFLWACWWWGDLTSGAQQALSTSPPPPSLQLQATPTFLPSVHLHNKLFSHQKQNMRTVLINSIKSQERDLCKGGHVG